MSLTYILPAFLDGLKLRILRNYGRTLRMTQSLKIKWLTWVVFSYERWLLSGTCFNCCTYSQQCRFWRWKWKWGLWKWLKKGLPLCTRRESTSHRRKRCSNFIVQWWPTEMWIWNVALQAQKDAYQADFFVSDDKTQKFFDLKITKNKYVFFAECF